jgi:hypothetical protein
MIALGKQNRKLGARSPQRKHWEDFKQNSCFLMEPEEFLAHWDVDYSDLALLAGCSVGTVKRWFCEGGLTHRNPQWWHKFRLAYWNQRWQSLE